MCEALSLLREFSIFFKCVDFVNVQKTIFEHCAGTWYSKLTKEKGGTAVRVTYLDHSGFLLETAQSAFLFDWFRGEIPVLAPEKKLFVLVSHSHGDHYSAEVFTRFAHRRGTEFIVSPEVPTPRILASVTTLAPHESAAFGGVRIETLGSTDEGVSFLVETEGKRIFHMGDLNWWDWGEEDTPEEAAQMERDYRAELAYLPGRPIDLAFVPLDPRLGEGFYKGIDALMRTAEVKTAIPMHCWGRTDMAERLAALEISAPYRDRVIALTHSGETAALP